MTLAVTRETPRLAKLARPRIQGLLPRQRLFELLDRQRERPIVWIVGPPGAGKTSLVATYVEARRLPALWYDVDRGESDPASLFYYLHLAAAKLPRGKRDALPLLSSENLGDLPGFTRRFFESLYERMSRPSVLVLDNYHEVPADSSFHSVMEHALYRVPEGVNVIVMSRAEPPPQCSRHVANGMIARIDFQDLRLTFEETSEIAGATHHQRDLATLRALHTQADGWAAGTILMLEHVNRTGALNFIAHTETMDTVFNYFAGQFFDDLPSAARDTLLLTSLLPRVTKTMAVEMTGSDEAGQVLEELHRGQLFTERRTGKELTYHYHALFRAFLLALASERYTPAGLAPLRRRAANLLEARGDLEEAVALYQDACDWKSATPLILKQASAVHSRGGQQTLRRWIEVLPEDVTEASPWLLYWLGVCDAAVNPGQSRSTLERAFALMKTRQDTRGQIVAAARIVDSYYLEWADFNPLDEWIGELERLLASAPVFPSKEVELGAVCAMLVATMSHQPQHPMLPACADRAMTILYDDLEPNDVVTAGTYLLHYYCNVNCDAPNSMRVIARVGPLLDRPELAPFKRVVWLSRYARYCSFRADFETASRSFNQALEIIEKEGLGIHAPVVQTHKLLMSMTLMDASVARSLVAKLEPAMNPGRRIDRAILGLVQSWIALQDGDVGEALRYGQSGLRIASEAGAVTIQALCMLSLAAASSDQRDVTTARGYIDQARSRVPLSAARLVEHFALMLEARAAFDLGDIDTSRECLRSALGIAKREEYVNVSWHPRQLSWVCEFALDQGIEVGYIQTMIRRCGVLPPSPDVEAWPWPVKIYTLGRFSVEIDGGPLSFPGKSQKKPLDLLKALIALGGREVDFTALMGILWPDATGDAQKSLEMTLSRLRKLLGHNDSVLMQEGKLSLNPHLAWVDMWAFERSLSAAGGAIGDSGFDADRAQRAFALYKGRFLASEPRAAWMQATADRLQAKFIRLVLMLGRRLEATSWEQAAHVYERGLELENLAEELYQRLMVCHRERGRVADAMNVYRRCRDNLSIILGIAPSSETAALFNALRQ
jgi:LuxR family maltose regulon positive regulatory protein